MPCIDTGRISLFVEDAGTGGVPVLLLHELGGSSESWHEVIPLLASDLRILAVDLRCVQGDRKSRLVLSPSPMRWTTSTRCCRRSVSIGLISSAQRLGLSPVPFWRSATLQGSAA